LDNSGGSRAESCVGSDNSCDDRSSVTRWRRGNASWGWGRDWLGDLARAVGDGESLAGGGRVGLAVGNYGGCGRAVGRVGCNRLGGPDSGAWSSSRGAGTVPSGTPSLGSGDESEDGEESLNRLHYCGGERL